MNKVQVGVMYGAVGLMLAVTLSGCQLFGNKDGEVSDEASTIEVVPVTPSEEFSEVSDTDVETVDLTTPEATSEESTDDSVRGALRYYIADGKVLFSVEADQSQAPDEDEASRLDNLVVWVKGAESAWQRVCALETDKGGLQCGGTLSEDQLPLEVGLVRGSGSPSAGAKLLLKGLIPASESTTEQSEGAE